MVCTLISPTGQLMYEAEEVDVAATDMVTVPAPISNAVMVGTGEVEIPVPRIGFPIAMPVKSVTPVMTAEPSVFVPTEPYNPHRSRAIAATVPAYAVVALIGVVADVVGNVAPNVMYP